ncbi:MAG: ATP-dependent sacrificial sulfur transferase LarE [Planctomycetota bacterium]
MDDRLSRLNDRILQFDQGVVVAFSGGVDSALLLRVSVEQLGDRALAVTAESPSFPEQDRRDAVRLAREFGTELHLVQTQEMDNDLYRRNEPDRCYHCKLTLFECLRSLALERGFQDLAFGANKDDEADFRPGHLAARELKVHAPLLEVGLTKVDVRELARDLGISVWNKPASACLSSRVPFGTPIDRAALLQIDSAESLLRRLGYAQCRVRHHGETARIELPPGEIVRAAGEDRERIQRGLEEIGFRYVTVDLAGYRSGSLNPTPTSGRSAGTGTESAAPGSSSP